MRSGQVREHSVKPKRAWASWKKKFTRADIVVEFPSSSIEPVIQHQNEGLSEGWIERNQASLIWFRFIKPDWVCMHEMSKLGFKRPVRIGLAILIYATVGRPGGRKRLAKKNLKRTEGIRSHRRTWRKLGSIYLNMNRGEMTYLCDLPHQRKDVSCINAATFSTRSVEFFFCALDNR